MAKKILKVKIQRNQTAEKTSYVYPLEYNPRKIQVIAYETFSAEGDTDCKGRGNTDEFMIGYVEEADVPSFVASPDIVEIDRAEAEVLGAKWIKPVVKITDETAVLMVLAKAAKQEVLSADDLKVIDEKDPTAGITLTKGIGQILDDIGIVK